MNRERRLGRGLEALLGRLESTAAEGQAAPDQPPAEPGETQHEPSPTQAEGGAIWIPVPQIDPNPFQPRAEFDQHELQTLADSLKAHGMLQPVLLRRAGDRFQLISGERRWRAAGLAGWEKVSAQIWDVDDRQMAELALVENVQRKDLNPLEKAASFQRYLQQYQCTQEELAARVKLDRSTIANLVRLLELPARVQDALRSGTITQGHARALLPVGDEREQNQLCERIQAEGLSVRATEELAKAIVHQDDGQPKFGIVGGDTAGKPKTRSEHLAALEQELRSALGTKVDLRQAARGRGRIVIHFNSGEEFERLRDYLNQSRQSSRQVG